VSVGYAGYILIYAGLMRKNENNERELRHYMSM
jgi:hypothetical protein